MGLDTIGLKQDGLPQGPDGLAILPKFDVGERQAALGCRIIGPENGYLFKGLEGLVKFPGLEQGIGLVSLLNGQDVDSLLGDRSRTSRVLRLVSCLTGTESEQHEDDDQNSFYIVRHSSSCRDLATSATSHD
jgi:hypothetical protein